jgi:hypothetical protein
MRRSRIAGLLLVSMAALAQQQPVEITSEPRHHLVFQNEYVRVFDVTVEPRGSTLVHRHNYDYLFVTLGDSDVVSARPGEKPVQLLLKDGETRFTAGNFSHAAINNSQLPFHNITIELLKPSTNVKTCTEPCPQPLDCPQDKLHCPAGEKRISSDQWSVSSWSMPANTSFDTRSLRGPSLLIAVTNLDLSAPGIAINGRLTRQPGGLEWIPTGWTGTIANSSSRRQAFVILQFAAEKQVQ